MDQPQAHWTITPETMLNMVNDKRREHGRAPIDHTVMTTRLVLRSHVICPGVFDFRAPQIRLEGETLPVLEELLNEQFDLHLRNELRRRSTFHPLAAREPSPSIGTEAKLRGNPIDEPLAGRLKRLFGLKKGS